MCAMAQAYHHRVLETDISTLLVLAEPGASITPERARWYASHLKTCRTVALGHGIHYLQEDHPDQIGKEIASWITSLN
jgi:haloalkane dehalogenase